MGKYKVGIEKKEKLYQTAKALFYEKGYIEATCKEISKAAEMNVGLINYYFGSKGALAVLVYSEFMTDIKIKIKEKLEAQKIDAELLLATALEIRFIYRNIKEDENFGRFYNNLMEENIIIREKSIVFDFFRILIESYQLDYSDTEISSITYGNLGMVQGMSLAYDAGLIKGSIKEYTDMALRLMMRMMEFDKNIIERMVERSWELEKQIDFKISKAFKIS